MAGFLASTFAASVIPAAIPVAALAGTLISDPGQVWHAGDRHKLVADTTSQAKDEMHTIVSNPDGFKTPEAKQAFDKRMAEYTTALQETKDQHGTLDVMLKWASVVVGALGGASLAVGAALAASAIGWLSVSWIPGPNAAVFAEANSLAGYLGTTLRALAKGFINLLSKLKTILSGIKSMSLKRKLVFAALGTFGLTTHQQLVSAVPIPHKKVTWPTDV
jgi:hypothetical protein